MNLKKAVNSIGKIYLDLSGTTYINNLIKESDANLKERRKKQHNYSKPSLYDFDTDPHDK
ncbi:hypothetical protein [Clostridium hydrogenum]|uniref:hypothetical protein n=1 Tax=Clostridium hydrogenum TaxID=2855764 RepID=UPI001F20FC40|nr:hypothetical protein [Clostridium hydrogenum]